MKKEDRLISAHAPSHEGPHVEISLEALGANYAMLHDCAPGVPLAPAVKCDAYGLGAGPISRALRDRKRASSFFVVYAEEGKALRDALGEGETAIYCFAGPSQETLPLFEAAKLTPVLNSLEQARAWAARCPHVPAALHVDTGMNRLGAPASSLADIAYLAGLDIALVMSHLACSSTPAHAKNAEQRARFIEAAQHFPGAKLSLAASAGALMGRDYHFDLIRPGVALYGGSPFGEDDARIAQVATLRAPVLQIRDLSPGESVGYDATFVAARPSRIATVGIGYGDGYPRAASGRGAGLIAGVRAPVVGRVSMDFVTLDVTDLKAGVEVNDMVEFFGPGLRLFEAAAAADRIPYDLLTGLGARVDRRYV